MDLLHPFAHTNAGPVEGTSSHPTPMPEARRARLMADIEKRFLGTPSKKKHSHATRLAELGRIQKAYCDLHLLNCHGLEIDGLKPIHLTKLVRVWRYGQDAEGRRIREPISWESGRNIWRTLKHWCVLIGKAGMVGDFESLWPKDAEPVTAINKRGGDPITSMSREEYAQLLSGWKDQPTKLTEYFLVRTICELGLTREEAVILEPVAL
jgi:hypothetical protein